MTDSAAQKIAFLDLIEQFGTAKNHFANSQREVLLGFREICRILVELVDSTNLGLAGDFPVYVIKATGAVIDYLVARIPEHGRPEDILTAKIQAIDELIGILDEEAIRLGTAAKTDVDLAKVEAIGAIKKYLLTEKTEAIEKKEDPDGGRRIRKINIE